ncbi:MAG: Rieske (2Fe-2S) protein [Bacteroidota bacterium]|nr:Rieske (2Fe-2S) protein [Bacteroidota bacterium]MDP4229641.1 Rieske (2Fe-2S) protein [Bacteroidota bacterium]MDP4234903.1 Rieske (2Fe-2S) protein [Bacteroidota bacterium]
MDEKENGKEGREGSVTRRYFLELLGLGSIGIVSVGSIALSASYLSPNVVKEPPTKFKLGTPSNFSPGSVTLIQDQNVFVVRAKEGYFFALSATCTHLGCITNWKGEEGIIACPCHGSKFNREGTVIGGPAPKQLPRFEMTLDDQGNLIVDKGVKVDEHNVLKV